MPPFVELNGVRYHLGKLAPDPAKRKAATPFSQVTGLIPRSGWTAIDRRAQTGPSFVLNQQSHSSCTGFGSAGALMKGRLLAGMQFAKLSGSYIYSFVNGGRDDGAAIHDTLAVLTGHGTCLDATCPWNDIYTREIPQTATAEAQRFKVNAAYPVNSFDEAGTALMMGYILVGAVMVGNNFMNLDANGVVGFDSGPGNHCIHWDGLKQINGQWDLDLQNSWGADWGQQGRAFTTEQMFESVQQDCYAIEIATADPQDTLPAVTN